MSQHLDDPANLANDFPSPEPTAPAELSLTSELAAQALAQSEAEASPSILPDPSHPLHQQEYRLSNTPPQHQSTYPSTHVQQLALLRDYYAKNPNPSKKEIRLLAERTGRTHVRIREYFRQRRNKLRDTGDLDELHEPRRATAWLQMTYRPGRANSTIDQLSLYNAYKTRFDPYHSHSALLGGTELMSIACVTFPGCTLAKEGEDHVVKGLSTKEDAEWEKTLDGVVEPIRASTWLLGSYQHSPDRGPSTSVPQTEVYTSYAARFASLLPDEAEGENDDDDVDEDEQQGPEQNIDTTEFDSLNMAFQNANPGPLSKLEPPAVVNRILNPIELITLVKMTFPKTEVVIDDKGRFVLRGLERRDPLGKAKPGVDLAEVYPFAADTELDPSHPKHPFTILLKRKLAHLQPEADSPSIENGNKRAKVEKGEEEGLTSADRELLEGLKRFKSSHLGREIRDACVSQ